MHDSIVIYLHTEDFAHPSWVVLDEVGQIKQAVQQGDPAKLILAATQNKVIVVVPAEDVLLTFAHLPKMNRSRLLAALPYALEEQLVADVDGLHFAPGKDESVAGLPVAIVAKEKMREWLAVLQAWNIQADVCVPMSLILPMEENVWQVMINDVAVIRTDKQYGFAGDKANLRELLSIALSSAEQQPVAIHIHNYSNQAFADKLGLPVTVQEEMKAGTDLYADLARHATKQSAMNLLQGEFRIKKSHLPHTQKIKKLTSYLAVFWVLLLFIYPTMSYFILNARASNLQVEIAQIYKRNFPAASSIVAPKERMQEKLQKYTSQLADEKLLIFLSYLGQGVMQKPSINVRRLDYSGEHITLELSAASSEDFAGFVDFMKREGMIVKQQNASLQGARVNGVIVFD